MESFLEDLYCIYPTLKFKSDTIKRISFYRETDTIRIDFLVNYPTIVDTTRAEFNLLVQNFFESKEENRIFCSMKRCTLEVFYKQKSRTCSLVLKSRVANRKRIKCTHLGQIR